MDYLLWHYTHGLKLYLRGCGYLFRRLNHFFSFPVLLKTLFSPWKKMVSDDYVGLDIKKVLENLTFNLISIGIGFSVRLSLLFVGFLVALIYLVVGLVGLVLWLFFPFISLGQYYRTKNHDSSVFQELVARIKSNPSSAAKLFLSSPAGKFFTEHLADTSAHDLFSAIDPSTAISSFQPANYQEIVSWIIDSSPTFGHDLRRLGLKPSDFVDLATWWDEKIAADRRLENSLKNYGRSGIGLELISGYTPTLNNYSQNLNRKKDFYQNLVGRRQIVERIQSALKSSKNVFLIGQSGVGKMTVVYQFAHEASTGQLGNQFAFRRIVSLDLETVLSSGNADDKKALFRKLISEASRAGDFVLVVKNLHQVINQDVAGYDFTDIIASALEKSSLKIIAVLSSVDYQRFLSRDSRLSKYFDPIEVLPPSKEEAKKILFLAASQKEASTGLIFSISAINALLDGSERYITETPFPEKTLDLLGEVAASLPPNGGVVTVDQVNEIISLKTKIPLARLTESEKQQLSNLEQIIHQELIDQDSAVSLIAKSLRSRSVGLKDEKRPVGSFLFLGPSGVGKTQTAKVLAKVYYGSGAKIIRFDMAQYVGPEGVARLIGSAAQNQPGELTSTIKNQPASLLLLDEIEKSPPEIFNLFLTLLDEGYITDAFGQKIICSHLFVIATSNAGAEHIRQLVGSGVSGDRLQTEVVDFVQKSQVFSPEFINRFDGVVVFEPLDQSKLVQVAGLLLKDLQNNLKLRNILVSFDEQVPAKLVRENFDPAFGARPLRRAIDLTLSDIISRAILSGEIKEGDNITVSALSAPNEFTLAPSP